MESKGCGNPCWGKAEHWQDKIALWQGVTGTTKAAGSAWTAPVPTPSQTTTVR